MSKRNCWEHFNCGREPDGARANEFGVCPATTDSSAHKLNGGVNAGRLCWATAGTFCGGQVQGTFAAKELTCMTCDFFRLVSQEEGSFFALLKPGQEYRRRK